MLSSSFLPENLALNFKAITYTLFNVHYGTHSNENLGRTIKKYRPLKRPSLHTLCYFLTYFTVFTNLFTNFSQLSFYFFLFFRRQLPSNRYNIPLPDRRIPGSNADTKYLHKMEKQEKLVDDSGPPNKY